MQLNKIYEHLRWGDEDCEHQNVIVRGKQFVSIVGDDGEAEVFVRANEIDELIEALQQAKKIQESEK